MTPVATVLLPVRNGERYLSLALDSVLGQTLSDLELLVVDDGSYDATPAILTSYASRDARVRVLQNDGAGMTSALNLGLAHCQAPFVVRMDADDIALPDRLMSQISALKRRPDVVAVGGAVEFMNADGRRFATVGYPLENDDANAALARNSVPIVHPAATLRRAAILQVGGYRPVAYPADDFDLWLRLAELGALINLPDVVLRYRIHPKQVSNHDLAQMSMATLAARASAEARRTGKDDPLEGVEVLTSDVLSSLGICAADLAQHEIIYSSWLARTNARAGEARAAGALWRAAETAARRTAAPRDAHAQVLRSRARFECARRRPVTALQLRLRAGIVARLPDTRR
jgi:GT2 family glycosyltransferase